MITKEPTDTNSLQSQKKEKVKTCEENNMGILMLVKRTEVEEEVLQSRELRFFCKPW